MKNKRKGEDRHINDFESPKCLRTHYDSWEDVRREMLQGTKELSLLIPETALLTPLLSHQVQNTFYLKSITNCRPTLVFRRKKYFCDKSEIFSYFLLLFSFMFCCHCSFLISIDWNSHTLSMGQYITTKRRNVN